MKVPRTTDRESTQSIGRPDNITPKSSASTLRHTSPQSPFGFMTTQPTTDPDASSPHQSLVVTAGNNVSFACSSPAKARFLWSYCELGCRGTPVIYNGRKVNEDFHLTTRSSVSNCGDRKCTFHVANVQLIDAGSFSCIAPGVDKQWSITILGK